MKYAAAILALIIICVLAVRIYADITTTASSTATFADPPGSITTTASSTATFADPPGSITTTASDTVTFAGLPGSITTTASDTVTFSDVPGSNPPDTDPPTDPANLSASAVSTTQIDLTWDASTDDSGSVTYLIERCQSSGCGSFSQIDTSGTNSYSDNTGLAEATFYNYRVRATDPSNNNSEYSNTDGTSTQDATAPSDPSSLVASAISSSVINLTWSASTDNSGSVTYKIERCTGDSCDTFSQIDTSVTNSYNSPGLTASTLYRYQVRASDASNNNSGYSNIAEATTDPPSSNPTENLANNTVVDLGAFTCTQYPGDPNNCYRVTDYTGMTYDQNNHQMLMFGGGHATTFTDTVFVFSLESFTWSERYAPTPCVDYMNLSNLNTTNASWLSGPSGPYPRAISRHTYDLLAVVDGLQELIVLASANGGADGCTVPDQNSYFIEGRVPHYNLQTNTWSFSTTSNTDGSPQDLFMYTASEYDPVSGKIIMVGRNGIWIYDPNTRVKVQATNSSFGTDLGYANQMVYFPPTDKMYYFNRVDSAVYEVTLNRSDFGLTTIVPLTTTGTYPPHVEPGFAYDSVNQIIGGAIIGNAFYVFNPITNAWSNQAIQGGSPIELAFHAIDYDPVNNVFIFLSSPYVGTGARTWAYRYAQSDFQVRCSQPGVLRCVDFEEAADISGVYGNITGLIAGSGPTQPSIDSSVASSGVSSLKFTIDSQTDANGAGAYFANFSDDFSVLLGGNTELYVQWRQRFDSEFISHIYQDSAGWKQVILSAGDEPGCTPSTTGTGLCKQSCTALELVTQNSFQRGFPQMYNSCTGSTSHGPFDPFVENFGPADFKLQNNMPDPYCLYSQGFTVPKTYFPPDGNCFGYFADEWLTYKMHVSIGPRSGDEYINSHVDLWIAREGQSSVHVFNWGPYNLSAGPVEDNLRYGKIWLLPYQTDKNASEVHTQTYTWYDDLIISTQQIADPQ